MGEEEGVMNGEDILHSPFRGGGISNNRGTCTQCYVDLICNQS